MPAFLEKKLEAEYGKGNPRVYATMNSLGYMHGNKETAAGRAAQAKHDRDQKKKKQMVPLKSLTRAR